MLNLFQKRRFLEASVKIQLPFAGKNLDCLEYTLYKLEKLPTFTLIFTVYQNRRILPEINLTSHHNIYKGERQLDKLSYKGLLVTKQNLGPEL